MIAETPIDAATASAVTPEEFRGAMASVCTPVTVVAAMDGARPHATTVSAFSSLSLEPPLILVALDNRSELLAVVRTAGRFAVNLLSRPQADLALRFARKGRDKLDGVRWRKECGVPRLADAAGWLACELRELVQTGDHAIAIGLVVAAEPITGAPLVYHQQRFGTHSDYVAAGPVASTS
jgi:flavin reductase (DIM6/NTAB) family NADH-FMN oxidoreductase RutF